MTSEEAWLAAILADPGVTLIYADWLDEHNRPNAAAFWRKYGVKLRVWRISDRARHCAWWWLWLGEKDFGKGDLPTKAVWDQLKFGDKSRCRTMSGCHYTTPEDAFRDLMQAADACRVPKPRAVR